MHSPLLPALAACCSTLFAMCGSSGASSADGSAALKTDSYLDGALDPAHIFHWTARTPGAPIELFVEVLNAPHELPAAFQDMPYSAADCADAVRKGIKTWATHAGAPMRLELALHDQGQTFDAGLVRIEVSFRDGTEPGLEGYTRLHTAIFEPALVEKVSIELRIGPGAEKVSNAMIYALLLHEFGHALGIVAPAPRTGHSNRVDDVMFPTVRWSELSGEDRRALRELYQLAPTMSRADAVGGDPGDSGPSGPDGPGGAAEPGNSAGSQAAASVVEDGAAWLLHALGIGPKLRSEPARPAPPTEMDAAAELVRCGSCAR